MNLKAIKFWALAAYNAGRGHVEEWMSQYDWGDDFDDIEQIPFAETREYVTAVLKKFRKKYESLYAMDDNQ